MPQQTFADTQVLIGALQFGALPALRHCSIASIAASELLGMQGRSATRANYYIPLVRNSEAGAYAVSAKRRRDHPFSRIRTDVVKWDFGTDFPAMIEYGNIAVSDLINRRSVGLFDDAIAFMSKEKRKALRRKFDLLMDLEVECVPLSRSAARTALRLLQEFTVQYDVKAEFRNTWNDMLIAAAAIDAGADLITLDKLLARYLAQQYSEQCSTHGDQLRLAFPKESVPVSLRESKQFVNRGWAVRFGRNR
jgi:predicted nucleic acid-binding protein